MIKQLYILLLVFSIIGIYTTRVDAQKTGKNLQINKDELNVLLDTFKNPSKNAPRVSGKIIYLYGKIVNQSGEAVPNLRIEIWQTDSRGYYDHVQDSKTKKRDLNFQFYGSTTTDKNGLYIFRTILPGEYYPRPRHIHFKIKDNKTTLLTSQFYFTEDLQKVNSENMFAQISNNREALLLQLIEQDDKIIAEATIVIQQGRGKEEYQLTPSQSEGPYYPLVDLSNFDNDLIIN